MADNDITIDPASFEAAAGGVEDVAHDLRGAYVGFKAVLSNLGNFLHDDDAGQQLKAEYEPAHESLRTAMDKLIDTDLQALSTSLRNDAKSWRNADQALLGD